MSETSFLKSGSLRNEDLCLYKIDASNGFSDSVLDL